MLRLEEEENKCEIEEASRMQACKIRFIGGSRHLSSFSNNLKEARERELNLLKFLATKFLPS